MTAKRFLYSGFLDAADRFPDRPALVVGGRTISYLELLKLSKKIAATIQRNNFINGPKLTAVFAYRTTTAFAGVLGALLAGHGYVPLNRTFPVERTRLMLQRSGCKALVVDEESSGQLKELLEGIADPLLLIFLGHRDSRELSEQWPGHIVACEDNMADSNDWGIPSGDSNEIAYLLFTSGSTGIPKGVMVAHRNVTPFIAAMVDRYKITEKDRFSQLFDMTFDLSVFDMFVAWERGACVCCPTQKALLKAGSFIKQQELSIWFSVPSTVLFMKRFGMLKPNSYPSLRYSLFCGEPLPVQSLKDWGVAAPDSVLENLYGPTEVTIACTLYRWVEAKSDSEAELGVVPIGYPYPNMETLVVDEKLVEVPPGSIGELLMAGPQVTLGYLGDPKKTDSVFVTPPGKNGIYYRTGDLVRRPLGDGPLTHLGRVDFQVKIAGHRVELGEVESVIRKAIQSDAVVAVGWPVTGSGADGIEVFVEGPRPEDMAWLHEQIAKALPSYMIPKGWHFLSRFPLNVNGKTDRKALLKILEEHYGKDNA